MPKVAIVADSSVSLPAELVERYNIRLVPLAVIFGDKVYRDRVDITPSDFYRLLEQAKELPTTSAPNAQAFVEAFQEASRDADAVACILLTQAFSPMGLEAALQAKEMAKEVMPQTMVKVIDSRTAVGAYGLIALAAARAAAAGEDLPGVVKAAEEIQSRVTLIIALDTLKYLAKGGRIGKAAFWAGSLLNIKPILEVPPSTGAIEPLERVRTKRRALERLVEIMEERVGTKQPLHVIIDHANVPREAEWLMERVSANFDCAEIYIIDWAPSAGVHCGPGVIGLSFYADAQ